MSSAELVTAEELKEIKQLLKEQNSLALKQIKSQEREAKKTHAILNSAWLPFLVVITLAYSAMGLWGLKHAAIAVLDKLPFIEMESAQAATGEGSYASPIVGKSLQELVDYTPAHGQSFGPETGNKRSYGAHGGIDFDCRVGGCAGAAVASPINGTVTGIEKIGTSSNGASYRLKIAGKDWAGPVEHRLVHVDSIMVSQGDAVTAGQVVARVSPTDSTSTGPHLDWKIKRNGSWENPQTWAKEALTKGGEGASMDGVDLGFIKNLEGFHPTAYYDGAQNSWGYGTKAGTGTITREQAEQEMEAYLAANCMPIIPEGLPPNRVTAMASFCYNLGPDQAKNTDLWRAAEAGNYGGVNFLGYTRSTVGVSLLPRRQKEQAMWDGN